MKERIVLFGAGAYASKILERIEGCFEVQAICDNNASLYSNKFENKYKIVSISELKNNYKKCKVLIAVDNKKNVDDIKKQLDELNIINQHVNVALLDACNIKNQKFYIDKSRVTEIEKMKKNLKNIFILTAPAHSNMGDQAQSFCIEMLLRKRYPQSSIFLYDEITLTKNYYEMLFIIKQNLQKDDMILLHSGYRLTNLYMVSEYIVEMMAELFSNRKIVFLPQTINYTDISVEKRISNLVGSNVTVMCRDRISFEKAKRIFDKSNVSLIPDVVTSLIGKYQFDNKRNGVLLCFRNMNDGESTLSEKQFQEIKCGIEKLSKFTLTDTTIDVPWNEIAQNRKYYVEREIEKYSRYKLIITNRYHGTIYSLIANTPVIVLPTLDHKITSGMDWFEKAGYKSIFYCKDLKDILSIAGLILDENKIVHNEDYFYREYFENFKLEG